MSSDELLLLNEILRLVCNEGDIEQGENNQLKYFILHSSIVILQVRQSKRSSLVNIAP